MVIPVCNQRATIEALLRRVQAVTLEKEIVTGDDASTDGTREVLAAVADSAERDPQEYARLLEPIQWKDGIWGIWCILRYNLRDRRGVVR